MRDGTKIEWTHRPGTKGETLNPIRARNRATGGVGHYCAKVSGGCAGCYAETWQRRMRNPIRYAAQDIDKVELFLDEAMLLQPLRWRGPRTIFLCSMTDLFGEWVPDAWLDRIFAMMALAAHHTFIVLTKRPERMRAYMLERWQGTPATRVAGIDIPAGGETGRRHQIEQACEPLLQQLGLVDTDNEDLWTDDGKCKAMQWMWPLPNVWLGVSAEDQPTADQRIPLLLKTPAAIRFLSAEPLLGPIDLRVLFLAGTITDAIEGMSEVGVVDAGDRYVAIDPGYVEHAKLDWVIVGGESGPKARPMSIRWARELRDQCSAARVAFFFKQWGVWAPAGSRRSEEPGRFAFGDYESDRARMVTVDRYPRQFTMFGARSILERVGKKAAGRILDGRTHDDFPGEAGGPAPTRDVVAPAPATSDLAGQRYDR